jgi:transcriptional regulator with XRE-family HTH domain
MKVNKWKSLCKTFKLKNFVRLSELTGVPPHSFHKYSRGEQSPTFVVLYKLFKFGISISYLCGVKAKVRTKYKIIPQENVYKRVQEIFELSAKKFNLQYFQLARKIKVDESTLSRYRSGERLPSFEVLVNCKKLGINPDAFFSLEAEMFLPKTKKAKNDEIAISE